MDKQFYLTQIKKLADAMPKGERAFVKIFDKYIARIVPRDKLEKPEEVADLAEILKETYVMCTGRDWVDESTIDDLDELTLVPVTIRDATGVEYAGAICVSLEDAGEHWNTYIVHPEYGLISQDDFKKRMSEEEYKAFFPYKYHPLIEIVGDIHQDAQY